MENNDKFWGLFAVHKSSPNTRKVFKRIQRICGKNLIVHVYMEKTQKDSWGILS
jgi:hypothetical protein